MALDLSTLNPVDDGVALELSHPVTGEVLRDDQGVAISITLLGQDSEAYQRAENQAQNRRLRDASRGRRATLTAEQIKAEALEVLVACTVAWHGVVFEGVALECTATNVRRLYTERAWIREQVDAFVADRANFFGRSKGSSSPSPSTSSG
jgi:hypothetical protein